MPRSSTLLRSLALLLAGAGPVAALAPASPAVAATERPRDPFVFRCVLDDNARMVVVALADDLSVAWDAATGGLALAWAGDVQLQGAVYDTTHGPQPVHRGARVLVDADGADWLVGPAGTDAAPVPARVRWLGYRLDGDAVHLRYEVSGPNLAPVIVVETPEVRRDEDGRPRLERRFTREGDAATRVWLPAPMRPVAGRDQLDPVPLTVASPAHDEIRRNVTGLIEIVPGGPTLVTADAAPTA